MSLKIDFSNLTSLKFNQKLLTKAATKHLKLTNCQISLSIVSDEKMRQLNRKYLKHDYVTDVLSFSTNFPKIKSDKKILGEIIIAYPYIKKQAKAQNHSVQKELEILTIHGLNHLLGKHHH